MLQSWARWENYFFTIYIKWNLKAADSTSTNAPPGGQAGGGGIVLPDLPIPDVPTVYERQSYIMSPFGYLKVLSWVFLTMGWSFLVEEVHVIRGGNTKIEFVWITMLISWIVYRYVRPGRSGYRPASAHVAFMKHGFNFEVIWVHYTDLKWLNSSFKLIFSFLLLLAFGPRSITGMCYQERKFFLNSKRSFGVKVSKISNRFSELKPVEYTFWFNQARFVDQILTVHM